MKASTHVCGVGVDVTAVECDCAAHYVDATADLPSQGSTSVKASTPTGRWGSFIKASAYQGLVVVDITAVECDCATTDADATSFLPFKGSTSVKASTPLGRWGGFMCRKRSTYPLRAHKEATHSMSVKANTPLGRWDRAWWRVWWRLAERTPDAVFE